MWQKEKGKYHLLLGYEGKRDDGIEMLTVCKKLLLKVDNRKTLPHVIDYKKRCEICEGVWKLVFTSVTDAKSSMKYQNNLEVLRLAYDLSSTIGLKKSIEARIRRIEKNKGRIA